jgi:hypothetical protein
MEARATIKETSVSRFFVGAILVLVAMGLGAMGGYAVKGAVSATGTVQTTHSAPALPLRQDNDYPKYSAPAQPLRQDNDYPGNGVQQAQDSSAIQAVKGGTRGDHGDLP